MSEPSAVTKARALIEDMGGKHIKQLPCGCHVYMLGDGGAVIGSGDCDLDHSDQEQGGDLP